MCSMLGDFGVELQLSPFERIAPVGKGLMREFWRREPEHGGDQPAEPGARDDEGGPAVPSHIVLFESLEVLGEHFALFRVRFRQV